MATNMRAAYIESVLEHLPGVAVVLDHFHAVKLMPDVGPLVKMGKTMATYRTGILAWYDHHISAAPWEEPT